MKKSVLIWAGTAIAFFAVGIFYLPPPKKTPVENLTPQQLLRRKMQNKLLSDPDFKLPNNSKTLDAFLEKKDYRAFYETLRMNTSTSTKMYVEILNWAHFRQVSGGGYIINKVYFEEKWPIAQSKEKIYAADSDKWKASATTDALYTLAVLFVDGPMCDDQSAPSQRVTQFIRESVEALAYGNTLPKDKKEKIVAAAIEAEKTLAPLRGHDDAMCRGGLDEMLYEMNRQEPTEIHGNRNYYGRVYNVEMSGTYSPKYKTDKEWHPIREKKRQFLHENLTMIMQAAGKYNPPKQQEYVSTPIGSFLK